MKFYDDCMKMNKHFLYLAIFFSTIDGYISDIFTKIPTRLNQYIDNNRVIAGSRSVGFFSEFFGCLHWLSWAEKNSINLKIHWNRKGHSIAGVPKRFLYGSKDKNYWSEFFETFWDEELFVNFKKEIARSYAPSHNELLYYKSGHTIYFNRNRVCELVTRYISVLPDILETVESFYREHFFSKRVIALHLRSREKDVEGKQATPKELISLANNYWTPDTVFFVLTDSNVYLDLAKRELRGTVVATNSIRVNNAHSGVHLQNAGNERVAREALIDVLLASRSDLFIFTTSNLAFGALAFNIYLNGISVRYNVKGNIEQYVYNGRA